MVDDVAIVGAAVCVYVHAFLMLVFYATPLVLVIGANRYEHVHFRFARNFDNFSSALFTSLAPVATP